MEKLSKDEDKKIEKVDINFNEIPENGKPDWEDVMLFKHHLKLMAMKINEIIDKVNAGVDKE